MVRRMHSAARFLQFLGLAIPPLAVVAQLMERISAGQMLQFLGVSVGLFCIGYLLQQYRGTHR
jgi:hypothetical protein